ncbi:hypothetical protein N7522_006358 [Penicillium canescens]|nr:hypothetical protein N7522_006358 [Penicillium canescens]
MILQYMRLAVRTSVRNDLPGASVKAPRLWQCTLTYSLGEVWQWGGNHHGAAFFRFCLTFQRLQYAAENAFELFREASICSPSRFKAPGVR